MPLYKIDFTKVEIYKLKHKDDYEDANVYIGSTTNFKTRKYNHKSTCNNPDSNRYNLKKYEYIRNNGGWDEWLMILIEVFPCNNLREAESREEYWRSHYKATLNAQKCSANVNTQQEYDKQYYIENKEKILERNRIYNFINKEEINEQRQDYRDNNKEKTAESNKIYRDNNKEKISEHKKQTMTCECGCIVRKEDLARHKRTQKHIKLMEEKNNIIE